MKREDNWKFYAKVDFADLSLNQYHVDTRDFHVSFFNKPHEIDLTKIKKYPNRFFFTPDEVKGAIERLFNESGGKAEWRYLSLELFPYWLKYIRIYRTNFGLIICDSDKKVLTKEILNSKVNQEHLNAH